MSQFRKNRGFQIEALEGRQMMAGDIAAFVSDGRLHVAEAAGHAGGAQAVQVSRLANGNIRVEGMWSATGGKSLVNGAAYRDFSPTNDLVVSLGGGDDWVRVWNAPFRGVSVNAASPSGAADSDVISIYNTYAYGSMDLHTGAGKDVISVQNSMVGNGAGYNDLKINAGVASAAGDADRDLVNIQGLTTRGATYVTAGASDDAVYVMNSKLGDSATDMLEIRTGAGADKVQINNGWQAVAGNLFVTTYDSLAENDADAVHVETLTAHLDVDVKLGGGNDQLDMLGVWAGRFMYLDANAGDDRATLRDVEARDNFWAYMGEGNDVLDLTYVKSNNMLLDGGGGDDRLGRYQNPSMPTPTLRNWEEINGVRQAYFTVLGSTRFSGMFFRP